MKRFKISGKVAGCYYQFGGDPAAAGVLLIGQGFATCASVFEATRQPVACAFNAGNLLAVARAGRERLPDARIVLLADDDWQTEGNLGLTKATEAARAIGGAVAMPGFLADRPAAATDFNDMAALTGLDSVRTTIEASTIPPAVETPAHVADRQSAALVTIAEDAIERTLAGDAGTLFEIAGTLRNLRAKHPADSARLRARIRKECREVSIADA